MGCTSCCRVLKSGKSRYGGGLAGSRTGRRDCSAGNLSRKAYLSAACSGRMKRGLGKAMLLTAVTHGPATEHGVREAYKYDGTFKSLVSTP